MNSPKIQIHEIMKSLWMTKVAWIFRRQPLHVKIRFPSPFLVLYFIFMSTQILYELYDQLLKIVYKYIYFSHIKYMLLYTKYVNKHIR